MSGFLDGSSVSDEKVFEVELEKMAYGGEALGRLPDGRAVFVPYASPGERVRVRLVEEKRGYARGELLEVLSPSVGRVEPRCQHYGVCGGCHYQHIDYETQLQAKAAVLADQLTRIGGLEAPPVQAAVPSPQPWNYRNHVQFHLNAEGQLGYKAARSEEVVAIQECHLPEANLSALWPKLAFDSELGLSRVGLRAGQEGEAMIVLEGEALEPPEVALDLPVAVSYLGSEGPVVLADGDHLTMEALGHAFRVTAGSFFQVNTAVAEAIIEHLLEHLPLSSETTLLELYCGVGLFSAFLAPRVGQLIGVEESPLACEDFVANLDEFDNVALYEGTVEQVLPGLDLHPDIVLVDPPRSGLSPDVVDGILRLQPDVLAYVSCDPATLGRDAKRLTKGGYTLQQVTPFDMFPQTYHIEGVSFWERGREV